MKRRAGRHRHEGQLDHRLRPAVPAPHVTPRQPRAAGPGTEDVQREGLELNYFCAHTESSRTKRTRLVLNVKGKGFQATPKITLRPAAPRSPFLESSLIRLFQPPNPVTIAYVGACTSVASLAVGFLWPLLRARWRERAPWVPLAANTLAGGYGLLVWVQALTGAIPEAGYWTSADPDPLTSVLAVTGLIVLLLSLFVLITSLAGHWRWPMERTSQVIGAIGLITGIAIEVLP